MGKAAAARKLASAAAFGGGGLSALGAGALRRAARRGDARAQGDRQTRDDAAARRDRLVRPRPARARRSGSPCSATPAPPATASTGSRRRPAPTSPAASPRTPTAGSTCGPSPWSARESSDLAAQVDAALPHRARPRRDPDRRQRRHPPGAAGRPRCATSPRRVRRLREAGRRRSSSAPAPTSAPSGRSRRRSSRSPGCGRAGWRPRRRSPSSRRAGARSRSATILGPEFDAAPALLFGPDRFHPSADGYRAAGRRAAAVRASPPSAWCPDDEERARAAARRGRAAGRDRGRARRSGRPAPSSTAPRSAARGAASAGCWVELRHRRRHPETDAEAPGATEPQPDGRRRRARLTGGVRPRTRQRPARSPGRAAGCWWRQSWLKIARIRSRLV